MDRGKQGKSHLYEEGEFLVRAIVQVLAGAAPCGADKDVGIECKSEQLRDHNGQWLAAVKIGE